MATKITETKKGFTIIEVVLVLAVAGLIFLMVFIALPALQRSQKDTQRRQAVSQVSAALTQYQTNNSTKRDNLPATGKCVFATSGDIYKYENATNTNKGCDFVMNYLNSAVDDKTETSFIDPDGAPYNLEIVQYPETDEIPSDFNYTVYVMRGAKCAGEVPEAANSRQFAVFYKLEGAGTVCLDNS